MRINKYVALHAGISRREADSLVADGQVAINGSIAAIGALVQEGDSVTVRQKPLLPATFSYIALHKPAGYVCSQRRQGDAPTVYELLPQEYRHLKLVGRLDKDSSGIILLTNDGDFAHRMTHPSFVKTKIYHVQLDAPLQPLHQQMISDFGVMLEDGKSQFLVAKLDSGESSTPIQYEITMHEGRNRQIRRTFAALGYQVTALHRVVFGPYQLASLGPGQIRPLEQTE